MIINPKKLIKMARKWQKIAAIRRKRILLPGTTSTSSSTVLADKGHFVVYTADKKRFVFPIVYLNNYIFRELFKMSEEEFGLPRDGPITLPCKAVFMNDVVSLIQHRATEEIKRALLMSIASTRRCSLSFSLHGHQLETSQQLLVCGF